MKDWFFVSESVIPIYYVVKPNKILQSPQDSHLFS